MKNVCRAYIMPTQCLTCFDNAIKMRDQGNLDSTLDSAALLPGKVRSNGDVSPHFHGQLFYVRIMSVLIVRALTV